MFKIKLKSGERLLALYRQTESVLFKPMVLILIGIYVPWFFLLKYELIGQFEPWLIAWTAVLLLYGLNKYFLWLLNCYVVTDERLIVSGYKTVFSKHVAETPWELVGSVSFRRAGIVPTLLRFGDVIVTLIHGANTLELKRVREPEQVKDYLWVLVREKPAQRRDSVSQMVLEQENHNKVSKLENTPIQPAVWDSLAEGATPQQPTMRQDAAATPEQKSRPRRVV